ncbi:hypothetical protein HWV62_30643 [Athelia sp. TMB]|nr:hypothetical protein HWV62_30643 [Athelia sp. TMB]
MIAVDSLPTLPALQANGPEPPNGLFTIKGSTCEITATDERICSKVWFKSPGWVDDPTAGNWTWFELAILKNMSAQTPRTRNAGTRLSWLSHKNSMKSSTYEWYSTTSYLSWWTDEESLKPGNVICVSLCARFLNWKNAAKQGFLVMGIGASPATVLHRSLNTIKGAVVDIAPFATPCRYRLVDCGQSVNHNSLRVFETADLSTIKYGAISYPWRGVPVDPRDRSMDALGTFSVQGAEDGDPISIAVVLEVCKAALQESVPYLWLDRLCIIQTNKEDKHWQIQRMHALYKGCEVCYVLPGGVRRLVGIEEQTSWIDRAWTLQEGMVPKRTQVIIKWEHGRMTKGSSVSASIFAITEITASKTAMVPLKIALSNAVGYSFLDTTRNSHIRIELRIFGGHSSGQARALSGAMNEKEPDAKTQAIWKCAMMRTSSRPVDMVFSIMGLFGVTLNQKLFDVNDREGATVALAQKILENGGRAAWLALSYYHPPSRTVSSFPLFPETSVSGGAFIKLGNKRIPATELIEKGDGGDSSRWLPHLPQGRMDSAGYLHFRARAIPLLPTSDRSPTPSKANGGLRSNSQQPKREAALTRIAAMDGSMWRIIQDGQSTNPSQHYAIFLGEMTQYSSATTDRYDDPWSFRALLVGQHERGKVHRISYFRLGQSTQSMINSWPYREFSLGGPQ